MTKQANSRLYELKITLEHIRPAVWRRFRIPGDVTLARLHDVIQAVMGWEDYHLHAFIQDGRSFGEPGSGPESVDRVEAVTRLGDVLTRPGQRLYYEYDFGDSWGHDLVLEKILDPEPGGTYPWVLTGAGACPPEDCGGIPGYAHLLAVLADPKHPEYRELREWAGGEIDPGAFSAEDINARLHGSRRPPRATSSPSGRSAGRSVGSKARASNPSRRQSAPPPRFYVTDMRHFLGPNGRLPEGLPGPGVNIALYIGSIVEWVTRGAEPGMERTNIPCRRRPGNRRCPSFIVARPGPEAGDIEWGCPSCGEGGVTRGWEGTIWDRSLRPARGER